MDGYRAAHAMIYQGNDFAGGIAKLRSLGQDDHPDVANLIGFSSRKLGRYDDAKLWYEKALAANPAHTLTWSYYGMWHAEQGNLLKARDHLAKVASICGTDCREYVDAQGSDRRHARLLIGRAASNNRRAGEPVSPAAIRGGSPWPVAPSLRLQSPSPA